MLTFNCLELNPNIYMLCNIIYIIIFINKIQCFIIKKVLHYIIIILISNYNQKKLNCYFIFKKKMM